MQEMNLHQDKPKRVVSRAMLRTWAREANTILPTDERLSIREHIQSQCTKYSVLFEPRMLDAYESF